jgi:hypothetical protein
LRRGSAPEDQPEGFHLDVACFGSHREVAVKFRKKPVVIEAVQWTGHNYDEVEEFMRHSPTVLANRVIVIPTLEGDHQASPKDWIIKGVNGEFYSCEPDIFEATYESVRPD